MKFWLKLMLCIIVIISIILSFSRYIIVRQNFINSINSAAYQYMNQNIMQRYYLESNIINNVKNGEEINKETIVNLVESLYSYMETDNCIGNKEKIFSNFDNIDNLNVDKLFGDKSDKYCLREIDGINYMIYSSYLSINKESIYIINIYDISAIYEERNIQIKEIMYIDIIVLIISSIFISIFSILFTRPIKKLNDMSRKISDLEESIVKFDEILLEVVLKNLISNAYKAEPKDNQIWVEGKKINNKYRISVIDTGRGIPNGSRY